ncbi:NAD(P)-binding protein [Daldinia loculata]|uniref:NAD(P)-binding protein n=1 Tax=Daldinia loculata TaxID=103429 RepID=UPI0020C22C14|nr:NAD(P)-binding protein [Daldinia loculata]KAI1649197.1 NAD(P)-binding protein [Daldinia loculata]KAI2778421.1 NAD(P)-binding protein [Daldinia loculata]
METTSLFRVDGMIAVVTGGATGLGFMMAKALAGAGAKKVYILGRRKAVLESAASHHPSFVPIVCDITSKSSLQSAVEFIKNDVGYINLLVANSGVIGPINSFNPDFTIQQLQKNLFEEVSMEDFTNTFHVNVTATYFTLVAFLELLDAGNKNALKGGFGAPAQEGSNVLSIPSQAIVTGSLSGFSRDRLSSPAYAGSKSAIGQLAKHASTNLAQYEIRVNALAPGLFPSELANDFISGRDPSSETLDQMGAIPSRRFGSEEDMGGSLLYLASRAGSYCNGLILTIEGGRLSVTTSTY